MTNQQGAPEALTAAQIIARFEREDGYRLEGAVPREWALEAYNELRRIAALVEAQQPSPSAAETECVHEWDGLVRTSMPPRYACKHCHNFFDALPSPTPQADPQQPAPSAAPTQDMIAAVLQLVDLEQGDVEDHRYDDGSKLAEQICKAVLALVPQPTPTPQADSQPAPVRDESAAPKLRAMAINYPEGACWDKLDAQTCMEGALEIEALRAARATADSVTAPAGVANWAQLRSALAMLMLGWGRNPNQTMDACYRVLDSATEPGTALAILRTAPDWRDFMASDRAKADSVLEDANQIRALIENPYRSMTGRHEAFAQGVLKTLAAFRAKHAARKQGGANG